MGTRRGEVPPARETRQALPEPERPGRNSILEPFTSAHRQRLTPPARPRQAELQLEPANRLPRNNGRRTSNPPCPYHSHQDKPAQPGTDDHLPVNRRHSGPDHLARTRERAGFTGNGPTYLA